MKAFMRKPHASSFSKGLTRSTSRTEATASGRGGVSGRLRASNHTVAKASTEVSQKTDSTRKKPAMSGPPITPKANATPMGMPRTAFAVERLSGGTWSATVANAAVLGYLNLVMKAPKIRTPNRTEEVRQTGDTEI